MGDLTKNFSRKEFACPCCGKMPEGPEFDEFIKALQRARTRANVIFNISNGGGFRCDEYSKDNDLSLDSSHNIGVAADILVYSSMDRYFVISSLIYEGFDRIGDYPAHVHVDSDKNKHIAFWWKDYK